MQGHSDVEPGVFDGRAVISTALTGEPVLHLGGGMPGSAGEKCGF
jgi:hypothetical protein